MRGKRRKRGGGGAEDNGFAEWGGYMAAKKTKLQDQFMIDAAKEHSSNTSKIFNGIAIFVNGYSVPSADELKLLMMKYGGVYHHYYRSDKTTHIIATNLPDTKVKQMKNMNVVKPEWIVESIAAGKLLDYREYLLYSRQSKTQPKLMFKKVSDAHVENIPSTSTATLKEEAELGPTFCNSPDSEEASSTDIFAAEDDKSNSSSASFNSYNDKKSIASAVTFLENKTVPVASKHSALAIKTASEAGFLSEFYSNSRLHHISTMGAVFKQYVNSIRENSLRVFPGEEKLRTWKESQLNSFSSCAPKSYKSVIMHIDMDCFFVSVGLRKRPDLKGFPVAVTHAKAGVEGSSSAHRSGVDRKTEFELYKTRREEKFKAQSLSENVKPWSDWGGDESNSMSEIASCNYEARQYGLKNGMFLGQALKLCPSLKTIPYDFEEYKEVSYCLYDTVASYTVEIEAISCDEMFVDCTSLLNSTSTSPLELASLLRAEIKEKTGCTCSTGFGSNRLQARLATRRAKPDGQIYLEPAAVQAFMGSVNVSDLPGVGRSTNYKLASLGIKTCSELQRISLAKLKTEFGIKSGESLYKHCRGEDTKKLVFGQVRKSVSAEVNYGIRFKNFAEAEIFLQELSKEVHSRLQELKMKTKFITLKLMVKAKDAPLESAKFLGHGICDNVSRSSSLQTSTADIDSITREVLSLHRQINIEPSELRGIGIQLSRLEGANTTKPAVNALDKFLCPKTDITITHKRVSIEDCTTSTEHNQINENKNSRSTSIDNFFAAKKLRSNQSKQPSNGKEIKPTEIDKCVLAALPEDIRREIMQEYGLTQRQDDPGEGPSTKRTPKEPDRTVAHDCDLNFSQIDPEVLEELPLEIKEEIIEQTKRKQAAHKSSDGKNSEALSDHSKGPLDVEAEGPKLDRSLSLSEVRDLIKAWTSSEECPQRCDVSMLSDYLEGLVVNRKLESLDVAVSCLHRCIEKKQSELWQEAYHEIISGVQSVMLAVYGLHLRVPQTFRTL